MKKIIVTTDFSSNSKGGIRFAIQLARQSGCELVFYHAIEVMKPTSWNETRYKKFESELVDKNVKRMERFVGEVYGDAGIMKGKHRYIAEVGVHVQEMIVSQAKRQRADYLCMSTRGAGKIKKLFGTHASSLITSSPLPLIVVPQNYRIKPVTHIIYASDLTALNREIKIVKEVADKLKAPLEVFHYDYLLHVEEVRKKLEKKVQSLKMPDVKFYFKKQNIEDSIAEHLEEDVARRKPSLVVLFTKQNRNWFDRLFARKESQAMAFSAKIPLLVYRKKA